MTSGPQGSGDLAGALGAYETAPAIMLACEGDDMVLASANEAAREAFGDRCQFGRPVREMAPALDHRTMQLMDDMVGTVFATGRSITSPAHRVQVRDEPREPLEVFWDLTFSPWFRDDGSVRGVLAHGMDVTETTRASRSSADLLQDVVAMQDALLPEWLPVLPGVEIAGRYLLAESAFVAGGDWYDAVRLPEGRVALIVGDVAGHGVAASAAMGRLRTVAEERLASGAGLEEVMLAVDSFARCVPEACAATVCVVVLDPGTGRLEYCTAGHPPPLVVRPDGRSRYLRHSGSAPLATTGQMAVALDHVDVGDLVVLFTDGILVRPGRSPAASTVELGQVAADAAAGAHTGSSRGRAERVCERTVDLMTRAGYADDIAVLVAEVTEPPTPLHLDLEADSTAVQLVLDALATWLQSMRARDLDHIVVQHAVDELATNIVEHAYPATGSPGHFTVDAELLASGEVEICFADTGSWVPPQRGHARGRGLTMVRGMVDRLVVTGGPAGTVATIRHRLSRPAHMLTGAPTFSGRQLAEADEAFTLSADEGVLRLAGSLDRVGLDGLQGALAESADLGRVVVDLGAVTHLPSSAVHALHVARRDASDQGQDLVLYAPAGTTAQQVLELVRLPYVLTEPEQRA
jgi:anti-sigma regulatory factor (Ser/Thr protein kinase)/anti-anti-sigma regulatory factor